MRQVKEDILTFASWWEKKPIPTTECTLKPAAEEVVDMRGGWADPDLFLWFGKVRPKKKKKKKKRSQPTDKSFPPHFSYHF